MKTAKALGFKKNDYALTSLGFVARLDSYLNTYAPMCEVWGWFHEWGSVASNELTPITPEEAKMRIQFLKDTGETNY